MLSPPFEHQQLHAVGRVQYYLPGGSGRHVALAVRETRAHDHEREPPVPSEGERLLLREVLGDHVVALAPLVERGRLVGELPARLDAQPSDRARENDLIEVGARRGPEHVARALQVDAVEDPAVPGPYREDGSQVEQRVAALQCCIEVLGIEDVALHPFDVDTLEVSRILTRQDQCPDVHALFEQDADDVRAYKTRRSGHERFLYDRPPCRSSGNNLTRRRRM